LLVTAPRKSGPAVIRNRFRRRARMAFLALHGERRPDSWVVWIRPSRRGPGLEQISYHDIRDLLASALGCLATKGAP
jgi:RNase P protein component